MTFSLWHFPRPGSCTSELQLKVNCRIQFGLARPTVGRPAQNFFDTVHFSLQFTFSRNSLVHDPALSALFLMWFEFHIWVIWLINVRRLWKMGFERKSLSHAICYLVWNQIYGKSYFFGVHQHLKLWNSIQLPIIQYYILYTTYTYSNTLITISGFVLNEKLQRNASKFAILLE